MTLFGAVFSSSVQMRNRSVALCIAAIFLTDKHDRKWFHRVLLDEFMLKTTQLWHSHTSLRCIIALGVIIDGVFVGMQNIKILADKTIISFMFYALKTKWKSSAVEWKDTFPKEGMFKLFRQWSIMVYLHISSGVEPSRRIMPICHIYRRAWPRHWSIWYCCYLTDRPNLSHYVLIGTNKEASLIIRQQTTGHIMAAKTKRRSFLRCSKVLRACGSGGHILFCLFVFVWSAACCLDMRYDGPDSPATCRHTFHWRHLKACSVWEAALKLRKLLIQLKAATNKK